MSKAMIETTTSNSIRVKPRPLPLDIARFFLDMLTSPARILTGRRDSPTWLTPTREMHCSENGP